MRVIFSIFLFFGLIFSLIGKDSDPVRQGDIKQLIYHFDKRFEQVDKRFEQVDKRFEQIDKRLDDLKYFMLVLIAISTSITSYINLKENL